MLLDVRTTSGVRNAVMVPSSGMETCQSDSTSSNNASVSTSMRSISSMSSTTGSAARMADSKRPREQELLGEDVLLDGVPVDGPSVGLDAQQLFFVVPLVQRLALVKALVALQADQAAPGRGRHGLAKLRLADARRTLAQDRLAQPIGEVDRDGDRLVREVAHRRQAIADIAW